MKKTVLAGLALIILTGCGGGGSSTTTAPPQSSSAEGMWNGTASNGVTVTGFVLDDGSFYAGYTDPYGSTITGIIHGAGSSSSGTYATSNAKDYYFGSSSYIANVTVSGAYVSTQSLNGTLSYSSSNNITFNATYDTHYDQTPSLSTLAGTYSGRIVGGSSSYGVVSDSATITISSAGTFSGVSTNGCSFNGTAAPRAHGNIYNVSVHMGASPCIFASQTLNGAIFYNTDTHKMFSAAPTSDRSGGFMLEATKL